MQWLHHMMNRLLGFLFPRRRLTTDLATVIVILGGALVLLVGMIVYFAVAYVSQERLEREVRASVERFARLIAPAVWDYDERTIRYVADAYFETSETTRIAILEVNGDTIYEVSRPGPTLLEVEQTIVYFDEPIGSVALTFSGESLDRIKRNVVIATVSVSFFVLLMILPITRFTLRNFLRKPLRDLNSFVGSIAGGAYNRQVPRVEQEDVNELIDNINLMGREIARRDAELRASEAKYRRLIEDSGDIIFSLNEHGIILTMNRGVRRHLGLKPSNLIGKSFDTLLYSSSDLSEYVRSELFRRKFEAIRTGQSSRETLKADFANAQSEPVEMNLTLEYIPGEEDFIIFGKAFHAREDIVARYRQWERHKFVLGNYLSIAEMVLNAATQGLIRYVDEGDAYEIRLGVKEMMINAIEHGNLAISYDEKTKATSAETYYKMLLERQKDPRYRNRKVTLYASLHPMHIVFIVRDDGEGFDWRKRLQAKQVDSTVYHGRGIIITKSLFDEIRYNDRGNQVTLIKRLSGRPPRTADDWRRDPYDLMLDAKQEGGN